MSISSCDVVCVKSTYFIVGCTPLPRYSVHQGPAIQYILDLSSWPNNVLGINAQIASASAGLLAGRRLLGVAQTFEWEDLFQLVIPSSCCDEPLKQQLWHCGSICVVSLLTLTADVLSVTPWSCFLKLCCNTFCCAIDVKIFSPTSFADLLFH